MSFIENNDISKKLVKTIKTFGKSILIISLPAIIILIILASFVWLIAKEDGTWKEEEKGNPDTYTSNATLSTTEGVTMDKTELVKQGLVDIGIDQEKIDGMSEEEMIEKLDMSNKLGRIITSIDECTQAEILWCINDIYSKYLDSPENLEYLLNAELVTQFPKIDNLSEEKVNGIIQFARINNISDIDNDGDIDIDDNPQILTYTNIEDFDTKFENYINSGNTEVFNYFTIDDQENVIIATWSEEKGNFESNNTTEQNVQKIKGGYTEEMIKNEYDSRYTINENTADKVSATYVTYNATKTKINYKSSIEKYTLSFKYLWALLIIGRSQDFVMDLAELAYNSQIIVGVYDSTTTIINTKISKYTENFRERYEEYEDGKLISETNWTNPPDSYSYQDTNIITTITDSVQYDIMYANTWIVEVRAKYKNIKSEESLPEEIITEEDEEWTDNGSYSHTYTRKEEIKDATGTTVIETKNIRVTEKYFKEKKTTGKSKSTTINNIYNKFEKVETEVKEKTDINSDTDMNFVKLLRDNNNAHNMLFESSNVEWLCQILEEYPDTANLIELTKYLINKAKNPDDTSLTFDFSIFGENSFYTIGGGGNLSVFGTTLDKDEFIQLATEYSTSSDYITYMVPYLGDFYDICTSAEYNINPVLAFAHACLETGYGSSNACKNDKNYFGMAHYNGASSGKSYNSVAKSIEDYCKWVINNSTVGTSAYSQNLNRAQEFATVNDKLKGTPDTNIYVLYCRYAQLSQTHLCDEPDFSNPAGYDYYASNGAVSDGRTQIYAMYEDGGIYTGEYAERCGHSNASDPTTIEERADYAVYSCNSRINIAKSIFGTNIFFSNFSGDIVESAGYTFPHYFQTDYSGSYGTSTIAYAGCGPTSLAMILAGLKNDSTITPQTVVDNIKEYWPDGSYYVTNQGSSHCIFYNSFLEKYYGVSSSRPANGRPTEREALEALENGIPVIGSEEGHILALIPAPDEYKEQGYKFYILDSARGHDGPYKSVDEANQVVKGNLNFIAIIYP